MRLELEDMGARRGFRPLRAIRKKADKILSGKVAKYTPYGQIYRAATGKGKIGAKTRGLKKRIFYNRKTGNAYMMQEEDNLSAAPLVLGAISMAKKAVQSPGGQKLLGKVFGKKAPAAAGQAVQSVNVNAELQNKLKEAMKENKRMTQENLRFQNEVNSLKSQRYYYGGGGFLLGMGVSKLLK